MSRWGCRAVLVYVATATVLELYWLHPHGGDSTTAPTPSFASNDAGHAAALSVAQAPPPQPAARVSARRLSPPARSARPGCWKMPPAFSAAPFDEGLASVVWTRGNASQLPGPLLDVPARDLSREWPAAKRARLEQLLPAHEEVAHRRFETCAVVGSSPEILLYADGAAIDEQEAVFRANLAPVEGFEKHVGSRTTVRVINPVESVTKARGAGGQAQLVIKNQDPPEIRSPSQEHTKWMGEVGRETRRTSFLARRHVLELCNFLMIAAGVASAPPSRGRAARPLNVTAAAEAFDAFVRGEIHSWHPLGDKIPRFSSSHCSTGTVLLLQALLMCRHTRLYGFHSCSCTAKCGLKSISARNHYWDREETPMFDLMFSRYENHMRLYQLLENACDVSFKIARTEHCDSESSST
ncbi:hypothetical protein AB1Y20_020837 [Prymnesium parvum]|uniref:Uncharacterized protein n=1 Tax=Prymnesium parvum TaxID=97485 RepID=A0AB34JYK6_PRYPA